MRSMITWGGVLAGSVALGVGMYGLVVAPATGGLEVLGITAAPEERPTVLQTSERRAEPKRVPAKDDRPDTTAAAPAIDYEAPQGEYEQDDEASESSSREYESSSQEYEAEYESSEREYEGAEYGATSSSGGGHEDDTEDDDSDEEGDDD